MRADSVKLALVILSVIVLSVIAPIAGWFFLMDYSRKNPETGINVPTADWLPETASDISFYRSHSWKAWEYTISENDFRESGSRYDLKEIEEPQSIPRFSWLEFRNTDPTKYGESYFREEQGHHAKVSNGLFASKRWKNGSGYHIIFDRDKSRVFFQSNKR